MRISSSFAMIAPAASYYLAHARAHARAPTLEPLHVKPAPENRTLSTTSNTMGPWGIWYLALWPEFNEETDWELQVYYLIPKNRPYETSVFARDCKTSISGIDVALHDFRTVNDAETDLLVLEYDLDKSAITGSNIWDSPSSQLAVCQEVRLVSDYLTTMEDRRVFEISFDLSVDFSLQKPLEQAAINVEAEDVGVASYVESCKCGGMQNFTCDANALAPNTELYLCIRSISSNVEVSRLDNIWLSQGNIIFPVVDNNDVSYTDFTSMEYKPNQNGVVVSTILPVSHFNYSVGESVLVTGDVDMKLVGDGRRLQTSISAPFGLEVALQQEQRDLDDKQDQRDLDCERSFSPDPANAMAFRYLVALGLALSLFTN